MEALIPLLIDAAPALFQGIAKGAGAVVGKAAGDAVVNTVTGAVRTVQNFGQPQGAGQQNFVNIANPQLASPPQPIYYR